MDPTARHSSSTDRQIYSSSNASSTRCIIAPQATGSGANIESHAHQQLPERQALFQFGIMNGATGSAPTPMASQHLTTSISVPSAMLHHEDSSSITSGFSIQSAPQVTDLRSERSGSNGAIGILSSSRRASKRRVDFERGYLKISAPMVDEIIKYRRTIVVLILTIIYAIFGLSGILFKSSPAGSSSHSNYASTPEERAEWTHEMIAGWHGDRPLTLTKELFENDSGRHVRVRECRSRSAQQHQHQQRQEQQQQQQLEQSFKSNVSSQKAKLDSASSKQAANKTKVTTEKPVRRRRKFEALNGCLFRREVTSESMGDLCCCAGMPRFVLVEVAANKTASQRGSNLTVSTTSTAKPLKKLSANSSISDLQKTEEKKFKRRYLRPHVMCFVSAAANLFNAQKLVAPLANEHNLKHTFVKDKGKCITCSCCHEHDPEKVNKLLANVPLYAYKSKSMMIDKNGNQLMRPANSEDDERDSGVWVRMRDNLVNMMRRIDDFFFWSYDLLEQLLFWARYGLYPTNVTDSTALILIQSSLMRPKSFDPPQPAASNHSKAPRSTEQPNLFMDEDSYDDFTTTTTTTTTTSTTTSSPKPKFKVRGNSTRRVGKWRKRKRRRRTTTKLPGSSTTSTLTGKQSNRTASSTSTTKAPTVIINVYAGNQQASTISSTPTPITSSSTTTTTTRSSSTTTTTRSSTTTTTTTRSSSTTTTTTSPAIMLISNRDKSTGSSNNIELHIKLDNGSPDTPNSSLSTRNSSHGTQMPNILPQIVVLSAKANAANISSIGAKVPAQMDEKASTLTNSTSVQLSPVSAKVLGSQQKATGLIEPLLNKTEPNSSIVISVDRKNSTTIIAIPNFTSPTSAPKSAVKISGTSSPALNASLSQFFEGHILPAASQLTPGELDNRSNATKKTFNQRLNIEPVNSLGLIAPDKPSSSQMQQQTLKSTANS